MLDNPSEFADHLRSKPWFAADDRIVVPEEESACLWWVTETMIVQGQHQLVRKDSDVRMGDIEPDKEYGFRVELYPILTEEPESEP